MRDKGYAPATTPRAISSEMGTKAIIDEAEVHLSEECAHEAFVAMLMALPGHHERATTIFLDCPALWRGATRFYHADTRVYDLGLLRREDFKFTREIGSGIERVAVNKLRLGALQTQGRPAFDLAGLKRAGYYLSDAVIEGACKAAESH